MRLGSGAGAIVAGGASGLGAATARRLAATGAVVTVADVDEEKGAALAAETGARFVRCDVREEDQVRAAVESAAEAAGPGGLRVAVATAGSGFPHKIAGSRGPHPLPDFKRIIELNLVGTFNVMRLAATAMLDNDPGDSGERGVLVNTASVAAFEGQVGQIAYSASKGGIVSMTLTAARDLARNGIRVVTIAPGIFDTPLLGKKTDEERAGLAKQVPFPRRLGEPDEYARLVEAIMDNPMLNGTTLRLDGAIRMAPR
ncbi:MAG: SDR family NAD(P)-dependent oxidoreductase [Thermoleophilaceae bacterium]